MDISYLMYIMIFGLVLSYGIIVATVDRLYLRGLVYFIIGCLINLGCVALLQHVVS